VCHHRRREVFHGSHVVVRWAPMKAGNKSGLSSSIEPWGFRGVLSARFRQTAKRENKSPHTSAFFDCTAIRVIIIDPYNQEIRTAIMARGAFAVGVEDGGCTVFCENLTRMSELHLFQEGGGPHCFVIDQFRAYHGLGFVIGSKDAEGDPRSSTISVAKLLSKVWFPATVQQSPAKRT